MNETILNKTVEALNDIVPMSEEKIEAVKQLLELSSSKEISEEAHKSMINCLTTIINMEEEEKNYNTILNRVCIKILLPTIYSMHKNEPLENNYLFMQPRRGLNQSCRYIYRKMEREYDCNLYLHELRRGEVSKIEYFVNALLFIRNLATAKAVFVHESNNLLGYIELRPETKVVQLWHGCGVLKKLGLSTIGKKGFKSEKGHIEFPEYNKYSIVTIASPELSWVFEEFMGIEKESGIIQPIGVSRTDEFFDKAYIDNCYKKLYKAIPEAKNKKIILYAPTYRGLDPNRVSPDQLEVAKFAEALGDDYILIFKHHQTAKNLPEIPEAYRNKFAYDMTRGRGMDINELMVVSDICITDYSSVAFEFSLFERPLLFFVYDLEEYIDGRGLYYDFEDVTPGPLCKTNEEMIDYIEHIDERFNKMEILDFKHKFMRSCDGYATDRILDYVGLRKTNNISDKDITEYTVCYSSKEADQEQYSSQIAAGQLQGHVTSASERPVEFYDETKYTQNNPCIIGKNFFSRDYYSCAGWYLSRYKKAIKYWYCWDGIWRKDSELVNGRFGKRLYQEGDVLDNICKLENNDLLILEAQWLAEKSPEYKVYYFGSGANAEAYSAQIQSNELQGQLATTPSGNFEFRDSNQYSYHNPCTIGKNYYSKDNFVFTGWTLRKTVNDKQYWYCVDKEWHPGQELPAQKQVFKEGDTFDNISSLEGDSILVFEAKWISEEQSKNSLLKKVLKAHKK